MGTIWAHSGLIERDNTDARAPGAKAYFFDANTTTPKSTYSDGSETIPLTHPVLADGNGRWPFVSIPYGDYDVQVTTSGGTQLFYYVNVQNDAPPDPGAGVDANALLQTGDIIYKPLQGERSGFVRCNGRTLGNAASGATERAHADTSALFTFLWNSLADAEAAVSGGRGGSAASDYAANKTIVLPDLRGRLVSGLDDMGTTAAGRLTGMTTAGVAAGATSYTVSQANLPDYNLSYASLSISRPAVSFTADAHGHGINDSGHTHSYGGNTGFGPRGAGGATPEVWLANATAANTGNTTTGITLAPTTVTGTATLTSDPALSGTLPSGGSGTAMTILPLLMVMTAFIKL